MSRIESSTWKRWARALACCSLPLLALGACITLKAGDVLPQDTDDDDELSDAATREPPKRRRLDGGLPRRDASDERDATLEADARQDASEGEAGRPSDPDEDDGGPASMVCADRPTQTCTGSVWPDGVIPYRFADDFGEREATRAAMDRWERVSAEVVRFVEVAPETGASVRLHPCAHGGRVSGYDGCENGCDMALCAGSLHAALGRLIGLPPYTRRFDRDHYVRMVAGCDDKEQLARCSSANNATDLGPFDYASAMLPRTDPSLITRWDGKPICAEPAEAACASSADREPTASDGSAVIERYQLASHWQKFRRTVDVIAPDPYRPDALEPLPDDWGLPHPIAQTASPALETWEGESLAIYVRATDDHIYKKWFNWDLMSWTIWEDLESPGGLGDVSDPAMAGWGINNCHLIVRRGTSVYIRSNQNWTVWQSLGGPAAFAASSPAITSWGENRLDIIVRAQDGLIYHKMCSGSCVGSAGTWSDWQPLEPAAVRGKPAIVSHAAGKLTVFAHGVDGRIWSTRYADGAWGSWSALPVAVPLYWDEGCPDCSSPAAGARSSTSLDVYVRGADELLWSATWSEASGWAEFVPRGGVLRSSPATISTLRPSDRADVVAILEEEQGHAVPHRATWWKAFRPN